MKQLLLVRHAKSSQDYSLGLKDFDRPLNERGHRDAPIMAQRVLDKKIAIDAFISSTAKRAFTTATYFAEKYGVNENGIIKKPELYHAPPSVFFEIIPTIDDSYNTIAVFAHNPGISELANELTDAQIDDMPTCSIFAINIDTDSWKDFANAKKTFWFFDYPKNS